MIEQLQLNANIQPIIAKVMKSFDEDKVSTYNTEWFNLGSQGQQPFFETCDHLSASLVGIKPFDLFKFLLLREINISSNSPDPLIYPERVSLDWYLEYVRTAHGSPNQLHGNTLCFAMERHKLHTLIAFLLFQKVHTEAFWNYKKLLSQFPYTFNGHWSYRLKQR